MDSQIHLFKLPKLYENMDEATIGLWLKSEGDFVNKGDDLVELVSDKTTEVYPSPYSGTLLKSYCDVKSSIPISFILAAIGPLGSDIPDVSDYNEKLLKVSDPLANIDWDNKTNNEEKEIKRVRIAPAARALAKRNKLDLEQLSEHFGNKMINKKDVEAYIAEQI